MSDAGRRVREYLMSPPTGPVVGFIAMPPIVRRTDGEIGRFRCNLCGGAFVLEDLKIYMRQTGNPRYYWEPPNTLQYSAYCHACDKGMHPLDRHR